MQGFHYSYFMDEELRGTRSQSCLEKPQKKVRKSKLLRVVASAAKEISVDAQLAVTTPFECDVYPFPLSKCYPWALYQMDT